MAKKEKTVCGTCGACPCYLICPTQDPYQGDNKAENDDYELWVDHDYRNEAYGNTRETNDNWD